jgi:hypothetical protein
VCHFRFYNTVWLIANDVIIGLAFGGFLSLNAKVIAASYIHVVNVCALDANAR